MTNEERADKWFADNHFDCDDMHDSEYELLCKRFAQALSEAEARGFKAGIEYAAKCAPYDASLADAREDGK